MVSKKIEKSSNELYRLVQRSVLGSVGSEVSFGIGFVDRVGLADTREDTVGLSFACPCVAG